MIQDGDVGSSTVHRSFANYLHCGQCVELIGWQLVDSTALTPVHLTPGQPTVRRIGWQHTLWPAEPAPKRKSKPKPKHAPLPQPLDRSALPDKDDSPDHDKALFTPTSPKAQTDEEPEEKYDDTNLSPRESNASEDNQSHSLAEDLAHLMDDDPFGLANIGPNGDPNSSSGEEDSEACAQFVDIIGLWADCKTRFTDIHLEFVLNGFRKLSVNSRNAFQGNS